MNFAPPDASAFGPLLRVDLAKLECLARAMHERLPQRAIVALQGTLGAGKTRLVQAIASAAAIDIAEVTSPTFTIVQHYNGERRINHVDAYRLADEDEFIELGGEELLEEDALTLIEWPERLLRCLPADVIWLSIEIDDAAGLDLRTIRGWCNHTPLCRAMIDAFQTAGG